MMMTMRLQAMGTLAVCLVLVAAVTSSDDIKDDRLPPPALKDRARNVNVQPKMERANGSVLVDGKEIIALFQEHQALQNMVQRQGETIERLMKMLNQSTKGIGIIANETRIHDHPCPAPGGSFGSTCDGCGFKGLSGCTFGCQVCYDGYGYPHYFENCDVSCCNSLSNNNGNLMCAQADSPHYGVLCSAYSC